MKKQLSKEGHLSKQFPPILLTTEQEKRAEEILRKMHEEDLAEYPPEKDFDPKKIDDYLYSFSTYDIMNAFGKFIQNHKTQISSKEYWYALGSAYTDSDSRISHRRKTIKYFTSSIENREYLMGTSERLRLKELPENVRVFRGMTKEEAIIGEKNPKEYGISWTLSEKVANFFAHQYQGNTIFLPGMKKKIVLKKTVITKLIPKNKIIAYFNSKKEEEIIHFPWL